MRPLRSVPPVNHWTATEHTCASCGAPALQTRSGSQLFCSRWRAGCGWLVRTDGPTREECLSKFKTFNGGTVPEIQTLPGAWPVLGATDNGPPSKPAFAAQYQQVPVPVANETCKHPRLRAANGGKCPRGCP